ncbi:ABC transporter permease [Alicyclobacillus sp. ALC3]|uniref:ABC transporter permease n=1 Tax=Alicyclobacillus sp. ALC3 TaxID=2796143 RepID=UPI002379D9E0|nr:ABC transporter permease [Alicyclobacillus sp. ALC3]WDL97692.1 ABC transporter permease [Alicyclobacillus sp. ALC3]
MGRASSELEYPQNDDVVKTKASLSGYFEKSALVLAWILICIVFSVVEPSTFPTMSNLSSVLGSQAVLLVLTLGLLIPLRAGDYDLSIAGTLTVSSMIVAILNAQHHVPIVLTILIALLSGAVIGAVNAFFAVKIGIDPFIVTLGTGTVLQGVVTWISNAQTISGVSQGLINVVIIDEFLKIPLEFYYGLILCFVIWYTFEYTAWGRRLLFVGQGREVARLSGIRVNRVRATSLVLSGVVSALAGVLYAGTNGGADPTSGFSFLLPAFAAAFLGSTAIAPGRFNPWGALIAVYFLVTGITGLTMAGVQTFVQDLFYGGALIIAVAISHLIGKRRKTGSG